MAAKSLHNEKTDALFQAILSLESIGECYAFFDHLYADFFKEGQVNGTLGSGPHGQSA